MEFTAQQIAEFLQGEIVGNPHVKVNDLAKIEEGRPGALSFLANAKYSSYLYTTKSSIVLVNRTFVPEEPVKATLVKVDDAYAAIAVILNMIDQFRRTKSGISPQAVIEPSAVVGEDCYVGALAYIGEDAVIGKNCRIYPQVYIGDGVVVGDNTILYAGVKVYHDCRIGNNNIIHAGAVIGSDGFGFAPTAAGYKKIAQIGNVVLSDDVEIGANATIDRATMDSTRIAKGVKIDNLVQIAHNVEIGENTAMAAQTGIAGSTKIGSWCVFAGQVGVAGHIKIGDHVTFGAQSGVPNSVESNQTLLGYPAVPAREFAKQVVMVKKLPDTADRLKALEKEVAALKIQLDK